VSSGYAFKNNDNGEMFTVAALPDGGLSLCIENVPFEGAAVFKTVYTMDDHEARKLHRWLDERYAQEPTNPTPEPMGSFLISATFIGEVGEGNTNTVAVTQAGIRIAPTERAALASFLACCLADGSLKAGKTLERLMVTQLDEAAIAAISATVGPKQPKPE
jgi:hypothetical protein